jgi:hypothetical protein
MIAGPTGSGKVTFGHITSGSHATFGHEQWYILYYYYSKKKRGCTSGHAPNILPVAAAVDLGIYTTAADRGIYSAVAAAAAILTE